MRTLRAELEGHLALSPDATGQGRGGRGGESTVPLSKACQISIDARALAQVTFRLTD